MTLKKGDMLRLTPLDDGMVYEIASIRRLKNIGTKEFLSVTLRVRER